MKLKLLFLIAALAHPFPDFGQTQLNKSIPVKQGQTIRFKFDYPQLIRVTTWEGSEVVIQGMVSINGGENDDAFIVDESTNGNALSIRGYIKNMDELPQRVTLMRDGQKIVLRDKAELKKFQQEHGHGYNQMSFGPHIDIVLDIKIPRNMDTFVESVYGMVEVKNFSGPLTVEATYGGIDAALAEKSVGEITAETNYGEIYSNLDVKFGGSGQDKAFHTYVSAKPGSGPRYTLESKYGNVYIRKAQN
ncbi:MAG TPA: hypothetical protein VEB86_04650 [Chryseosolibacter sp.]|nr:hypothetical protein [Chryseosolibacter sp.]